MKGKENNDNIITVKENLDTCEIIIKSKSAKVICDAIKLFDTDFNLSDFLNKSEITADIVDILLVDLRIYLGSLIDD